MTSHGTATLTHSWICLVNFYLICVVCVILTHGLDEPSAASESPPCRTPFPPSNGSVTVWGAGYLVEFTCDNGLFHIGQTFGSCDPTTHTWSIRRPICASTACERPNAVINGRQYFQHGGAVVITTCNYGYKRTGSRKQYCDGYKWKGLRTRCRDRYPSRADKRQAYEDVTTTVLPNNTYAAMLEKDVLDADNTCYLRFTAPAELVHASVEMEYHYNAARKQWILVANYTCDKGYHFADNFTRYLYCKDYNWTTGKEALPECVQVVVKKDPCRPSNGGCAQVCVSHLGGRYSCACNPGYTLGYDRKKCLDVDECELSNGGCGHTCTNIVGSYFCTCKRGYLSSGHACLDEDECASDVTVTCQGECINTPGSYTCNCSALIGYTTSHDKTMCVDMDECLVDNGGCDQLCHNTLGSYTCTCKKGFKPSADTSTCEDLDECALARNTRCHHGYCTNTHGGYTCTCSTGYKLSSTGRKCNDVNECKVDNGGCHGTCVNTKGSFYCRCQGNGYTLGVDMRSCVDVNECERDDGSCSDVCVNTVGSYVCTCTRHAMVLADDKRNCTYCATNQYYETSSATCRECPEHMAVSDVTSAADVTDCTCIPGYVMSHNASVRLTAIDWSCVDIDECAEEATPTCAHVCENTPGSYMCIDTKQTYRWNNATYSRPDLDECMAGRHVCEDICINTPGSYRCQCASDGLKLSWDLASCVDINECMEGYNDCAEGTCVNLQGTYACTPTCDTPGFELAGGGTICEDIDECSNPDLHNCEHKCVNSIGSYRCGCLLGYALTGPGKCGVCPKDSYRDSEAVECTACPLNSHTDQDGSTSIQHCKCKSGYQMEQSSAAYPSILSTLRPPLLQCVAMVT